ENSIRYAIEYGLDERDPFGDEYADGDSGGVQVLKKCWSAGCQPASPKNFLHFVQYSVNQSLIMLITFVSCVFHVKET
ncbi:MAG: hypothetical protein II480_11875, partial [Bacteroidales bacterium]|nr:hypothetical protein [Bacteroidales bacterium]